jgi:hypothetical protein
LVLALLSSKPDCQFDKAPRGEPNLHHTILHVESSPLSERSVSRKLAARIFAELKTKHRDSETIE